MSRPKRAYRRSPLSEREVSLLLKMAKEPWVYSDPEEVLSRREVALLSSLRKGDFVSRRDEGGFVLTPMGTTVVAMSMLMTMGAKKK